MVVKGVKRKVKPSVVSPGTAVLGGQLKIVYSDILFKRKPSPIENLVNRFFGSPYNGQLLNALSAIVQLLCGSAAAKFMSNALNLLSMALYIYAYLAIKS